MTVYRAPHSKRPIFVIATTFILTLAALLLLMLITFPTILSTSWGQARLIHYANQKVPGQMEVQNISLSWFGEQKIEGLAYRDGTGRVFSLESATTQTPLLSMLWNRGSHLDAVITGLNLQIPQGNIALKDAQGEIHKSKDELKLHLSGATLQDKVEGAFAINAELDDTHPQKIQARVKNFPMDLVAQLLALKNPDLGKNVRALLGPTADLQIDQKQLGEGMELEFAAKSPRLQATFNGVVNAGLFQLKQPGTILLNLSPHDFAFLTAPTTLQLTLDQLQLPLSGDVEQIQATIKASPLQISGIAIQGAELEVQKGLRLNLSAMLYPPQGKALTGPAAVKLGVDGIQWNELQTQGTLQIDQVRTNGIALSNLLLPWKVDGQKGILTFTLTGDLTSQGDLQGSGSLTHWLENGALDFSGARYQAQLNSTQFPIALLASLTEQPALKALGDDRLDLTLAAQGEIRGKTALTAQVQGDNLDAYAALRLTEGEITLNDQKIPARLAFTLTPQRFNDLRAALKKDTESEQKFLLQSPAKFTLQIDQFAFPWTATSSWTDARIHANFAMEQVAVLDQKTGQKIALEGFKGEFKSNQLNKALNFAVSATQKDGAGHLSDLKATGTVLNGWTPSGRLNTKDLSLNVQAEANHLPAAMLCEVACLEAVSRVKVEALFGPLVDLKVDAQLTRMSGPVQALLHGELGQVELGALVGGGQLRLSRPFHAEFTATPQLGESVLQDLLPILGGMQSSNERLSVTIDPEGFSMPLRNVGLSNVQIGKMVIQLGNAEFSNQGQLGSILSLLKASPESTIQVWFTPIYLSLDAGVLQIERFDMLAMQRFPLATWGSVNIPGDKIDMVVGLSGRSLQNAFRLPIPTLGYMMQFPLRGPIGSASIDKTKAAAKIAALTAQLAGGPQGIVIGTVIGLASGAYTEPKAPPPTTEPLPWSTDSDDSPAPATEKKNSNPIKAFEKGIKKIFKNG